MEPANADQFFHIPDVYRRVLKCLDEVKTPVSWTLSKNFNGKFSLRILDCFPAKHHRKYRHVLHPETASEKLDKAKAAVPTSKSGANNVSLETPRPKLKRKKKTPSQIRRDKRRQKAWRERKLQSKTRDAGCLTGNPKPETLNSGRDTAVDKPSAEVLPETQLSGPDPPDNLPKDLENSSSLEPTERKAVIQEASTAVAEPLTPTNSVSGCSYITDNDSTDCDDDVESLGGSVCDSVPDFCYACGQTGDKLLSCSACKLAKYCNTTCQRSDWPEHKRGCAALKLMNSPRQ